MLWKLCYPESCETTAFAVSELKRYLTRIDHGAEVAVLCSSDYNPGLENILWVGRYPAFEAMLPACPDPSIDDGILIDVRGVSGIISGVNPRSVLLAVYRFLTVLGCSWIRPGPQGEIIPQKTLGGDEVRVCETPFRRHRGVCIEGAVSFDHVYNMIDWLPKVGMNSYFNQFMVPFTFFDRWYRHTGNPKLGSNEMTTEEVSAMMREHIRQIQKRGIAYHAVGHGWTCEPFGIEGNSWDVKEYHIPEESVGFLALVNGKRELSEGLPLNTNLCYSNAEVRSRMVSAVADYCKRNPEIDYLHFWLADGMNNHCECDNCKGTIPSDFYVQILNELDDRLTELAIDTKVVFLIYVDLLWEPQTLHIRNPKRFVLMFAPITRTYSAAYADADFAAATTLAPYERNRLKMPRSVAENVARLRRWQARFVGDSFIFDYHFMWDHFRDPGGMQITKVLFDDMRNLDKFSLNGMVSCQVQRSFFPTGIGMYMMAKALWNKDTDFDSEALKYFKTALGGNGEKAMAYLSSLSALFDPTYLRHEKPFVDNTSAKQFASIPEIVRDFETTIENALSDTTQPAGVIKSWRILRLHGQLCILIAKALSFKAMGMDDDVTATWKDIADWVRGHEMQLSDVLDVYEFLLVMKNTITGKDITLF